MAHAWGDGCGTARAAQQRSGDAHPAQLARPLHVLLVASPHVVLDQRALLAQDGGLAPLLLLQRHVLGARRVARLELLRQQPLARALLLLLDVLRQHLLAQVVLLVARLELDDLVGSSPRLLDLLERLALLLPQALQTVAQQLHVVLRAQASILDVEHVGAAWPARHHAVRIHHRCPGLAERGRWAPRPTRQGLARGIVPPQLLA